MRQHDGRRSRHAAIRRGWYVARRVHDAGRLDGHVQQALLAAGPFYFNVDPPSTDEFRSGVVIIQATEQTIIDALDPTLQDVTGGANGETGSAVLGRDRPLAAGLRPTSSHNPTTPS